MGGIYAKQLANVNKNKFAKQNKKDAQVVFIPSSWLIYKKQIYKTEQNKMHKTEFAP